MLEISALLKRLTQDQKTLFKLFNTKNILQFGKKEISVITLASGKKCKIAAHNTSIDILGVKEIKSDVAVNPRFRRYLREEV